MSTVICNGSGRNGHMLSSCRWWLQILKHSCCFKKAVTSTVFLSAYLEDLCTCHCGTSRKLHQCISVVFQRHLMTSIMSAQHHKVFDWCEHTLLCCYIWPGFTLLSYPLPLERETTWTCYALMIKKNAKLTFVRVEWNSSD